MSSLTDPNNVTIMVKYDRAKETFTIEGQQSLDPSKAQEIVWLCDETSVTATFNDPDNCPFTSSVFRFGNGVAALTGLALPDFTAAEPKNYDFTLQLTDPAPLAGNAKLKGTITVLGQQQGVIAGNQAGTKKLMKPPAVAAAALKAAKAAVKAAESARNAADAADKAAQSATDAAAWAAALASPQAPARKAATKKAATKKAGTKKAATKKAAAKKK